MKKYENFHKALTNLNEIFKYDNPYNIVELTGLVGLYEICFEQSWKVMKELLERHGYSNASTGSPKQIIKIAFSCSMISNEKVWLEALIARNNVTHSYNIEIANDIVNQTKKHFYKMFIDLDEELRKNWINEQ
jgi:nucleotidyltransferase substrate binding protein (TIGR01987 family)